MPKSPRSTAEIEAVRQQILDQAINIISDYGFDGFSMRRLAARLGIAAKTIYNYFANKDEIYLLVLTRGFELLNASHAAAFHSTDHPQERLAAMNRAYVEFGLRFPHYYNIMFNWDVPKYMDYVGTRLEPVALNEKQEGLKLAATSLKALQAYLYGKGETEIPFDQLRLKMLKGWAALHGIVSLVNSRVLQETLDQETTRFFKTQLQMPSDNHPNNTDKTDDGILQGTIDVILSDIFRFL